MMWSRSSSNPEWAQLAAKGDKGATGPQGLQGPQGDTGPPGPNDVVGNLTLQDSSATAGNVLKGGVLFMHNFGPVASGNTFLGQNAGNLSMSGYL
jgi:hypothetical protein